MQAFFGHLLPIVPVEVVGFHPRCGVGAFGQKHRSVSSRSLSKHACPVFLKMETPKPFTLNNGITVPAVGFGTFQGDSGNSKVKDAVLTALKLGYRHIDGAHAYGNEREIGAAIKESGIPRKEIFLTSKL